MRKRLSRVFLVIFAVCLACSGFMGCKNVKKVGTQFLDIYCLNVGYGYEWVSALADDFATLDWVKEKYPEFEYELTYNDVFKFASDKIKSGSASNPFDLLFSDSLNGLCREKIDGKPIVTDLSSLYKSTVIGENISFEEKVIDGYLQANKNQENGQYTGVSWTSGIMSFLYNSTLFDELNFEVPVTTDEMMNILTTVDGWKGKNAKYPNSFSIQASAKDSYWQYLFPIWWAQYEGITEFENFFKGISENSLSPDIFRQDGRLASLNVMDAMLTGNKAYLDSGAHVYDFMEAQNNFLMGKGLFYACGDWFDYEMRYMAEGLKQQGYDDTIRMMKMPVISSIVKKLEDKTMTDTTLSAVIKAIDTGAKEFAGVSKYDFDVIKAARNVVNSLGPQQSGVIPEYSDAKELAIDFLAYMATDRANLIYAKATNGASLPFEFDLKAADPEFYKKISPVQKDRISIIYSEFQKASILPVGSEFPLVYKGNLQVARSLGSYTFESYLNRAGEKRNTGKTLFDSDVEYWTTGTRWEYLINNSGLQ